MAYCVQVGETQVRELFDGINVSEHRFVYNVGHSPRYSSTTVVHFTTKGTAYEYNWMIQYEDCERNPRVSKVILVLLKSCGVQDTKVCIYLHGSNTTLSLYTDFFELIHLREHFSKNYSGVLNDNSLVFITINIYWKASINFHIHQLSKDFEKLYDNQYSSDVTFVFNNNKVIKAHKGILMSRSQVFQAMFQNDMLESNENKVEIIDMDPEIFEKLLHYIYTGKINLTSEEKAVDAMVGVDKYNLIEFRDYCMEKIIKLMNVENAADNLILSDLLKVDSFKKKIIEFILSKKQEFLKSEGYNNLLKNHIHLITELFEKA